MVTDLVGRVFRVDPSSGLQTAVTAGGFLGAPQDLAIDGYQDLVMSDPMAFGGAGGVVLAHPTSGGQTRVSHAPAFIEPRGVAIAPGPRPGTMASYRFWGPFTSGFQPTGPGGAKLAGRIRAVPGALAVDVVDLRAVLKLNPEECYYATLTDSANAFVVMWVDECVLPGRYLELRFVTGAGTPQPGDCYWYNAEGALIAPALYALVGVPPASAGEKVELFPPAPNPTSRSVAFQFTLPREGPVTFAVYDLSGRVVRTLVSATLPAGEKRVAWDGADGRGRRVTPGIYFARLEALGVAPTRRLAIVP